MPQAIDSTTFYVMGSLINLADIDSVTSEAAGHPMEHLLDGNLVTSWKPTSTARQDIIIDLNQSFASSNYAFGIFVRNYTTDHSAGTFTVYHSTDGVTWGSAILTHALSSTAKPIQIWALAAPQTLNRYLKITFTGMTTTIEVAALFILEVLTISKGPQVPFQSSVMYFNYGAAQDDATEAVSAKNDLSLEPHTRKYVCVDQTTLESFKAVFDKSYGARYPVVIKDTLNSTDYDPYVARLSNSFSSNMIDYQIYEIEFPVRPMHYDNPVMGY